MRSARIAVRFQQSNRLLCFFFFFQAEDGIRDLTVTGVQTCALPISKYRYNPLHNSLDAYALAYSIAALINNLFGRSKEPFWQQAYTNLVKFIILLHQVAYDYVTLFDVYECTISPEILEQRIGDAELRCEERRFLLILPENFLKHVAALKLFGFEYDEALAMYRARETRGLRAFVDTNNVAYECLAETAIDPLGTDRYGKIEAVKRWF